MERLEEYIAFDLEFNQHEGQTHLIQVSAVRFRDGQEINAVIPVKPLIKLFRGTLV